MKNHKGTPVSRVVGMVFVVGVVAVALIVFIIVSYFDSQKQNAVNLAFDSNKQYTTGKDAEYAKLFSGIFDEAKKCSRTYADCNSIEPSHMIYCEDARDVCRKKISTEIYNSFLVKNSDGKNIFPTASTYFIRLNAAKNIEKLYLSGEFEEAMPVDEGKRQVVSLLEGTTEKLDMKVSRFKFGQNRAVYLNDFYSEAEMMYPVKVNGKVVGAVVMLYPGLK